MKAGRPIDVRDPLAAQLRSLATGADAVKNILTVQQIFGLDLPNDPGFVGPITDAYRRLCQHGARVAAQ
jgi:mannitol-1-phosphate/altronate dehydrogenase